MFNVSMPMSFCARTWPIFLVHVGESFSSRGSIISIFILTMQRYENFLRYARLFVFYF